MEVNYSVNTQASVVRVVIGQRDLVRKWQKRASKIGAVGRNGDAALRKQRHVGRRNLRAGGSGDVGEGEFDGWRIGGCGQGGGAGETQRVNIEYVEVCVSRVCMFASSA